MHNLIDKAHLKYKNNKPLNKQVEYKTLNKILKGLIPIGTIPSLINLATGQPDYINNAVIGGLYSFGGLATYYSKGVLEKAKGKIIGDRLYEFLENYSKDSSKINGVCGSIVGGINLGLSLKDNSPYSLLFWSELSISGILIAKSLLPKNVPNVENYTEIEKRFLEVINS